MITWPRRALAISVFAQDPGASDNKQLAAALVLSRALAVLKFIFSSRGEIGGVTSHAALN